MAAGTKRRATRLGGPLLISTSLHLMLGLFIVVRLAGSLRVDAVRSGDGGSVEGAVDVELDDRATARAPGAGTDARGDAPAAGEAATAEEKARQPRRDTHDRGAARSGRAAHGAAPIAQGDRSASRGGSAASPGCDLLSMRCERSASASGGQPSSGSASSSVQTPPRPKVDRLGAFWNGPRPRPEAPQVVAITEGSSARLTRYEDGGRTFAAIPGRTGGRAEIGRLALLDLANRDLNGRSGRVVCDPYRSVLPAGGRTLVLLVDSSESMGTAGRTRRASVCAAGAALAALDRGYLVEVMNFSRATVHQPPTRDAEKIFQTIAVALRASTILPEPDRLVSSTSKPRDYVLITDGAIHNFRQVLSSYHKAFALHPASRAYLFLFGSGESCLSCASSASSELCLGRCQVSSREPVLALLAAGLTPVLLDPQLIAADLDRQVRRWLGRR